MKTNLYITALMLGISLISCQSKPAGQLNADSANNTDTVQVADMHNAENSLDIAGNSLDIAGTYAGTTPCADCPGIKTELTLNKDNTYTKSMLYLEKNDNKPFIETGKWSIKGCVITITPSDNSGEMKLFAGENYIQMLDADGNKIAGDLEKMYILNKK